jgi:hypothetical protein
VDPDAGKEETTEPQTPQGRQALAGLRAIWAATGQMQEESLGLECRPDAEGCAASIGFDGFADAVEPTANTTEAIDRLRRAWKTTLAREGKLHDPEESGPKGTSRAY